MHNNRNIHWCNNTIGNCPIFLKDMHMYFFFKIKDIFHFYKRILNMDSPLCSNCLSRNLNSYIPRFLYRILNFCHVFAWSLIRMKLCTRSMCLQKNCTCMLKLFSVNFLTRNSRRVHIVCPWWVLHLPLR